MAKQTITEKSPSFWEMISGILKGKGSGSTTISIGSPKPNLSVKPVLQPQTQPQIDQQPMATAVENLSSPRPTMSPEMIKRAIQVYGGKDAPLTEHAEQISEAQKFPFLRDNPLLPVIQGHLETSSGKNITRPNNLENWGINVPGNNEVFSNMTRKQVLDLYLSGVGQRSNIYKKFRTGKPLTDQELLEYATTYEPNNSDYGPNMVAARKHIMQQLGQDI